MSIQTKILIVEHDPTDIELLEYELRKGGISYVSETVQNEQDYVDALKHFMPDVILADFSLPSFDGPTAFKIRQQLAPATPFIFVSGNIGEENSIEYIKSGVTDYALKDKLFTLPVKIKRAIKEAKEKQQKNKTEEVLVQSEKRLARAQEVAHMGSWELNFVTNIVNWSDEACRIYGLPADQSQQSFQSWLSFIHHEDFDFVWKKIKEAQDSLHNFSFFHRIIKKDGSIRHIYSESKLEFDASGIPSGMYGIVHDVTEIKEAEEKLYKVNRLYNFISQVNQNIVRIKNEAELFRTACRIAYEFGKFKIAWIGLFGKQNKTITLVDQSGIPDSSLNQFNAVNLQVNGPQEHVGKTGKYYICNDIENDPELISWMPLATQHGICSCMILPVKKSGTVAGTFNLYATELNFFDKEEIKLLVEVTGDISFALELYEKAKRQKEAEELIVQNEKLREFDRNNLNALINNSNDAMWSVDKDFRLITSNNKFDELALLMTGKVIAKGENIFEAGFPAEQLTLYKKSYARAFVGETFTEIDFTSTPAEFWSEISYYPIRNGDEVIGTACYSRNITHLKLAELERIRMTNDLIQRNKDLEQFTYIVSHNLRAPVANIIGIADAIQTMQLTPDKEKQMKGYLVTSIKKLDEVIIDLNHILQVKANVNEKKETVRFSELLADIQLSIDGLIRKEEVKFVTNFTEVDEMETLKSYLYSIFFNLISNSIKYRSLQINPVIETSSKKTGKKIELIFKDNGLGIDLTKKGGQVFGLYKRFHSHTDGKGMGLYMVKVQVETLGGKINISSEVDKGTEFRIEFITDD